MDYIQRVV